MVANCSDINGAAGVLTDELAARGFETRNATNGAGIDKKLERSKIYVVKGSEAVARSLGVAPDYSILSEAHLNPEMAFHGTYREWARLLEAGLAKG